MALKLRVSTYGNQPMGASAEHVFGEGGGTIGRARNNDWVLPDSDRVVSGQHAVVSFANGEYRIRDTSTNGTFLNAFALSKGDERPIRNGDHLKIGPYEISVLDELNYHAPDSSPPPHAADMLSGIGVDPRATLDPLELLNRESGPGGNFDSASDFDFGSGNAQPDHSNPEVMGFELPRSMPDPEPPARPPGGTPPGGIPENWDETGLGARDSGQAGQHIGGRARQSFDAPAAPPSRERVPVQPVDVARGPGAPAPANHDAVASLLRNAGVPAEMITAETYAILGEIVQVVVAGVFDVLRARAQVKDQFRVPATTMKPIENNPLKFSINAQDALHNLFGKRNPGFQSPVSAFQESFDDIKAHQMAILAGMRAAYREMLEYFEPDGLEREFDKGLKRGVLAGVLNKSKYWDLYEEHYESLVKDEDSSFHRLFGDAFGRAYEEQMQRLSSVRNR